MNGIGMNGQVRLAKDRKKGDKIVTDSQERAYWRAYRPPPGYFNCLELPPYPTVASDGHSPYDAVAAAGGLDDLRRRWKTREDVKREVLRSSSAEWLIELRFGGYGGSRGVANPQEARDWPGVTAQCMNQQTVHESTERR